MFKHILQPIIQIDSASTMGHEAFLRPHDGTPPARFWEKAEADGLTARMEVKSWTSVLHLAKARALRGHLFVNVTPKAILDREFREFMRMRLGKVDPGGINLVPELVGGDDADGDLVRAVSILRRSGFQRISFDDLQLDNRSLLGKIGPSDFVKISISRLEAKREEYGELFGYLRDRRARVIGKNVERAEQVNLLAEAGINMGQGFLWVGGGKTAGEGGQAANATAAGGGDEPKDVPAWR